MGANPRTKGQSGEREICDAMNNVVIAVREALGLSPLAKEDLPVQRNQNQSAVGGSDLTNPFQMSIEVKRQEQLSLNTWWEQCIVQANREDAAPVLVYRQSRKAWRVRMLGYMQLQGMAAWRTGTGMQVEVSLEDFLAYFRELYLKEVSAH